MQRKYTPHTTQGAPKATADLYAGAGSGHWTGWPRRERDGTGAAALVTLAPTEPRFVSVCLARSCREEDNVPGQDRIELFFVPKNAAPGGAAYRPVGIVVFGLDACNAMHGSLKSPHRGVA